MKKLTFSFIALLLYHSSVFAQKQDNYRPSFHQRITYQVNFELQGFSLPFSSLKTYMQNKGISVGVSYDWTRKGSFQQVIKLGSFFNRYHGNTQHVSTSVQYNPLHHRNIKAGISIGAGYMHTGLAKGGWQQQSNGEWKNTPNKMGLLYVPASVQLGIKAFECKKLVWIPTLTYHVNVLHNYSPAMPTLPQSFLSIGSKIKLK